MPQKRHILSSTFKKVVVVRMDRKPDSGYLDPAQLGGAEVIDLLTLEGEHQSIPMGRVKCIYFVRDFGGSFEPARKFFLSRPRQEGLWVRLRFLDGEEMEGLVPNDLLGLLERGVQITPPDSHGNSLRLFIPRGALAELRVLGVVGAGRHTRSTRPSAVPQGNLFENRSE